MAQTNNALPTLKPKDDKHNIFNDGKERTIRYVEWKDEMKSKARSCAKNHGIKVLMGEMTDIPTGTTAARKKERFDLLLELYGRQIRNDMYQTNNAGTKTLTEHGELMLKTAFEDLQEWCFKLIECYTYSNSSSFNSIRRGTLLGAREWRECNTSCFTNFIRLPWYPWCKPEKSV